MNEGVDMLNVLVPVVIISLLGQGSVSSLLVRLESAEFIRWEGY